MPFSVTVKDRMMYSHTFTFDDGVPFTTGCTASDPRADIGARHASAGQGCKIRSGRNRIIRITAIGIWS